MMVQITAADVNKLRQITGAGMMDCKKALVEAEGDFDAAIDILRKKGQKVAANRADRESTEGVVMATTNANATVGYLVSVNCETDFVAKNEGYVNMAKTILNAALSHDAADKDAVLALPFDGNMTIGEKLIEQTGVIGEKIELGAYERVEGALVASYIHAGSKLATLVAVSSAGEGVASAARDVAMQVAAMNPVSVDASSVPADVIAKELEVGKELARQEGKAEAMLDKIAEGRLKKFFRESTLMEQDFIKDSKKTIAQYLNEVEKGLVVTAFKRVGLGV
jgi:elongation factor Ts